MKPIERLYALFYKLYHPCGGLFKDAPNPVFEECRLFYIKEERDQFIQRYLELKDKHYIGDIRCLCITQLEKFEITDSMDDVVDAI
jgi:hypothetical protein